MKIRSVGADWFRADKRTNRHDEVNSRCSQLCDCARKRIYSTQYKLKNRMLCIDTESGYIYVKFVLCIVLTFLQSVA
jgi:hypothetical protein